MKRYFSFGDNFILEVCGLPQQVADGEYLEMFRCASDGVGERSGYEEVTERIPCASNGDGERFVSEDVTDVTRCVAEGERLFPTLRIIVETEEDETERDTPLSAALDEESPAPAISPEETEATSPVVTRHGQQIVHRDGREQVITFFAQSARQIRYFPEDWKQAEIRIRVKPTVFALESFTANQLLSVTGFTSALLYRRILTIHCAYVLYRGEAILFAAPSGTGKSTQAELWALHRGAKIINGDRALLFRREDGRWYAGGISTCGSSEICQNITAPVRAVVLLSQDKENRVETPSVALQYRSLLLGCVFHRWRKEEVALAAQVVGEAVGEIPIYRLCCRPDEGAVAVLDEVLYGQE